MSVTALDAPISGTVLPAGAKLAAGRVVHSEWIKFRTLRSSWLTLVGAVVAMVAIGLVVGYVTSTSNWATLEAEDTAASAPVQGYLLSQCSSASSASCS